MLVEENEDQISDRRDEEEDEELESNIQQISKVGDLSPRHTDSLKKGTRKGRSESALLLQVRTRSRDKSTNSDQC